MKHLHTVLTIQKQAKIFLSDKYLLIVYPRSAFLIFKIMETLFYIAIYAFVGIYIVYLTRDPD